MVAHACNEPLRCPECIRRFWKWAQTHTQGRPTPRGDLRGMPRGTTGYRSGGVGTEQTFYEAAAKYLDVDARARGRAAPAGASPLDDTDL